MRLAQCRPFLSRAFISSSFSSSSSFFLNCGLEFNQRLKFILINTSLIRNSSRGLSLFLSLSYDLVDHARTRSISFARPIAPAVSQNRPRNVSSAYRFFFLLLSLGIDNLRQIFIIIRSPTAPLTIARTLHFHVSQRAVNEIHGVFFFWILFLLLPRRLSLIARNLLFLRCAIPAATGENSADSCS